jgi:orotidine-5'-phosphate decarboxylase
MDYNPIICAIDTMEVSRAKTFSQLLSGQVGALKLGLEFFTANGAAGVAQIASPDFPVFLDLKFHDIPNTVAKAVKATAAIDAFLMTVHTQGGKAMMKAAADAASENAAKTGKRRPMVVGVTILTSMDQADLGSIGVSAAVSDQVLRLAELARESGLDGVVCSPHEIALIKKACGRDFKLVVPGIRPAGSDAGDQKRVLTPKEAVAQGADYLVIGRPITESPDPRAAAEKIRDSI